jgi:hypothetical protein
MKRIFWGLTRTLRSHPHRTLPVRFASSGPVFEGGSAAALVDNLCWNLGPRAANILRTIDRQCSLARQGQG